MAPSGPDASNSCLPGKSPVVVSVPPIPSPQRGERCPIDGKAGRLNSGKTIVAYASGKFVVVRNLLNPDEPLTPNAEGASSKLLPVLVYRGHQVPVTGLKVSPSGAYVASGDERGMLRVWALDHEDHLCKYDGPGLAGPIRDFDWDGESKRICFGGERNDPSSDCAKAIQWDTGVTVGQLSQHLKGRVATVAFKQDRPFRIVTGGKDDTKCLFHKGPPFQRIPPENGVPAETSHTKGAVTCIRYSSNGAMAVSVSTDRSICLYEGKDFEFKSKLENIHSATIYGCAWSSDNKMVLTSSGDGTCKLIAVNEASWSMDVKHEWKVAEHQAGGIFEKVPVGGTQLGCAFLAGDIPISVGFNGQISVLPMPGGNSKDIQVITGHNVPVAGFVVDFENNAFYTGDTDGKMCLWDLGKYAATKRLEHPEGNADLMYVVHSGAISDLALIGKGTLLSVGWDDKMYITEKGGTVRKENVALGAQPSAIGSGTNVAVIATVQGLLVAKEDGSISGSIISIPYAAQAVCVSKDDKIAYVGGDDCKIHIYDISDLSLKKKSVIENGHLKPIHAFALSNDGKKLASADVRDVCLWDLTTGPDYKAIVGKGRWCFHVQRVTCLSWSSDDKIIASGGADDAIYLWSVEKTMKRIHYPYAHRGGLVGLQFLKEGYKLLSVGADMVVNVWDAVNDVKEKFS